MQGRPLSDLLTSEGRKLHLQIMPSTSTHEGAEPCGLVNACAEPQFPHLFPITSPHAPQASDRPASLFFIP